MYQRVVVIALFTLMMSGCAGFKANNLPVVAPSELTFDSGHKTKVFSRWSLETKSTLVNEQMKAAGAAVHKKYFEDAINNSGCCVLVEGPTEAEVIVDGKAIAENNPAAMIPAVITGLSLFTIPSWVTATNHIKVEAKKAGQAKTYDLKDSMTMVQWLPMIVAMPFRESPLKAGKALDENVHSNLLVGMKEDGILQ